jgi:hypothetical protein
VRGGEGRFPLLVLQEPISFKELGQIGENQNMKPVSEI